MLPFPLILLASFASYVITASAEDLIDLFYRATGAGPAAGQIIKNCNRPGVLALAFDDGPYIYTQQLVDTLNSGGVKGTFFMTGTLYGCIFNHTKAIQNAFASGHQIASHTWTHPIDFGNLTVNQLTAEMTRLEEAFAVIIGEKPTYMRPPYLATTGNVLPTMAKLGYRVITDDVDAGDWNNFTVAQSENAFLTAGPQGNGHIPLMHEVYKTTVEQLVPWLIDWARNNTLQIVTVADCLGDPDGAYADASVIGNGTQTCS